MSTSTTANQTTNTPDTLDARAFYVFAQSDRKRALLAGPYDSHDAAEAAVPAAREVMHRRFAHDVAASFAEVGTLGATLRDGRRAPLGKLNSDIGYTN